MTDNILPSPDRVDWVDYAKGICIIAVVIFYCVGGVEAVMNERGWMRYVVDFAHSFRMPDFFLVAGLFVSSTLKRPWRSYLDTKVVHFLYFYAIWITIEFAVMNWRAILGPEPLAALSEYARLYIQPEGHLWFIYMLPVYFVATRLLHGVHPAIVITAAILLKLVDPQTGWKMIDRFGMYFIFFYCGHLFAPQLFRFARWVQGNRERAFAILTLWVVANTIVVKMAITDLPSIHLVMGLAGAMAVLVISALIAGLRSMEWLRYLGANSIVVYLAFFFPMIISRKIILDFNLIDDPGTVSFVTTIAAIAGAVLFYWIVRRTPLRYLFQRPSWAKLQTPYRVGLKKAY